jgi:hypothetical protein
VSIGTSASCPRLRRNRPQKSDFLGFPGFPLLFFQDWFEWRLVFPRISTATMVTLGDAGWHLDTGVRIAVGLN